MSAKHRHIRKTALAFYIYSTGYFLRIGPYVAVAGLQSSINIEKSIGTISLGIAYIVSVLTALFLTPVVIRRCGCKWAIVMGEVANLLYIAANFYPRGYIMITAGIIVGIGEGLIWTTLPMFSTYFGIKHGQFGRRPCAEYIRKYTGIFFGIHYAGLVFGTAMGYAFLYGGKRGLASERDVSNITSYTNVAVARNQNVLPMKNTSNTYDSTYPSNSINFILNFNNVTNVDAYLHCGSSDCQETGITEVFINNYVPAERKYLNILLGVFCALTLVGIVLHIRFLPLVKPEEFQSPEDEDADKQTSREQIVPLPTLRSTLIAICHHNLDKLQLLICPLVVYNGLVLGFYLSELVRAFTSCILGVEQAGLSLMALSITSAISSVVTGKLMGIFGRNIIMSIMFVIDISNYAFCLWWRPQENTVGLVYLIFVLFGITDACWKNNIISMYTDYFPKNKEIAYSVWNLWMTLGIATSFCWSPMLCVGTKIYAHCALLTLSVALYGVAEYLYKSRRANPDYLTSQDYGGPQNRRLMMSEAQS